MMDESKPKLTARIDIKPGMDVIDELGLEDDVVLEVRGKVTALRGPEEELVPDYFKKNPDTNKKKRVYPGSITMEITAVKVKREGEFDGMMDGD